MSTGNLQIMEGVFFLKKILTMILLLSLSLNMTACSSQENAANTLKNMDNVESVSAKTETKSEPVHQELTMDILLELYENGALAEKVDAEGLDGFLQYENLELGDIGDDSLTGLYLCKLVYSHVDSSNGETAEREYELQLYYWKSETAEEYGHEKNEINQILLTEKETGDAVILYSSDNKYMTTNDLTLFLEKEYGIEQYLTVSLPDGYKFGSYVANMSAFSGGWLLEGNAEEPVHSEWTDASWYAPGGIGRAENSSDVLQFDSGELTSVSLLMNHSEPISEVETIENCEVSTALAEYEFDLFTSSEWAEYLEKNPDASESECVSRYWYLFIGEEDSDTYYVLFLNEELFSKEDAIKMARSIHFDENAF